MKTSRAVARKVKTKSNVEKFLTYVGSYAKAGEEQSIVNAILADHEALKSFIKELKSEKTSAAKKRALYPKFESLLTSHTIAEEKALYSVAVNLKYLKTKTLEGKVEHDVAKALSRTIKIKPSAKEFDTWSAKVQVLAELVEHHLEEEESDLLPVVRRAIKANEQLDEAKKFLKLRRSTQKIVAKDNQGALEA